MQIAAFIAELAIEALDGGVLGGLAGFDEIEGDTVGVGPGVEGLAGKLWAVVDSDLFGSAIVAGKLVEHTGDPLPRQGGVDLNRQALSGDQIHDVERPESPTINQHILHEIHTPGFSPLPGLLLRATWQGSHAFALASAHEQALLAIEPVDALVINCSQFATEQYVQSPIAPAWALAGEKTQAFPNTHLIWLDAPAIPHHGTMRPRQPAGASL